LRFHVPDYGAEMRWRDAVAGAAQAALQRAGLDFARPAREVGAGRAWQPPAPASPALLLGSIDLFRPFTGEEVDSLAASMEEVALTPGEAVMRRGEQGDSLYLLAEGVLEVRIAGADGSEVPVDRLHPGAVFGEMSLLTGQPRSATILALTDALAFRLTREAIDPVLRARPALLEGLTAIMAARQARNRVVPGSTRAAPAAPTREDILARLKSFFAIR